ncbi:MAG: RagB/SusD family nutrient uptake outer membrane protein [Gemmatimonas sp.]|nr:RagB/SusD family nutrient uptake outer membrane protein [Gemmatimonas sp.]
MSKKNRATRKAAARPVATVTLAFGLSVAACDVINPGQILDTDLNDQSAFRVLVNGMAGDFADALDDLNWNNSVMMGDLSGTSAYLSRIRHWEGRPTSEDATDYDSAHAVPWVVQDGIERMRETLGAAFDTSPLAAEAHLWGGYANRLLGETMCQAIIEGGAPESREVYLQRADEHFTEAIAIATAAGEEQIRLAATGGRASVRINLSEWDAAVADAQQVPDDFGFYALYHTTGTGNTIWDESQSRVNLNVKYTWFEAYYDETGDPRTPWFRDAAIVTAADGATPQLMQDKYSSQEADVALTTGGEMRLIEAEALIREGQWEAGLDIVNDLRAEFDVAPWTAASQAEAMDALKKERAIELWLETRRSGDLYRWGGDPTQDVILVAMKENAPHVLLEDRATCCSRTTHIGAWRTPRSVTLFT